MNILLFSTVDKNNPGEAGVYKKILGEANAFRKAGFTCYMGVISENKYVVKNLSDDVSFEIDIQGLKRYRRNSAIYKFILTFIVKERIKVVYARLGVCSLQSAAFYKKIKKNGCQLLLEIPTWPLSQRWATFLSTLKSKQIINSLHELYNITINSLGIMFYRFSVDRIVMIGLEYKWIWGVPTIVINNGIDVSSIPIKKDQEAQNVDSINMICVANLSVWHGLEKAINGLATYYRSNNSRRVNLSIVGEGADKERLKQLVSEKHLEGSVFFKGFKTGIELDKEFDKADIAVSTLGANKGHLIISDSLKSKEYCARGIPFVTGKMEVKYNNLPFVLQVDENDTELDITQVVKFYDNMMTLPDLQQRIRDYSIEYCDWSVTLKSVVEYLKNNEN